MHVDQPSNKACCLVHNVSDLRRWIDYTHNRFGGWGFFNWAIILVTMLKVLIKVLLGQYDCQKIIKKVSQ